MHPVEKYLRALRDNRSAGVAETSNYVPLSNLLDAAGSQLKPRVQCVLHPRGRGAGIPDAGLFSSDQFTRGSGEPLVGELPSRGAVEAKPISEDIRQVVSSAQVNKYLERYRQVLVTTFRDWVLVELNERGKPVATERFRMAESEAAFWAAASDPRAMAQDVGERLLEFLQRVMLRPVPLSDPKDVAWLLAAYARDARFRVERQGDLPALIAVRGALEDALGVSFRGQKGEHFFRSTLVQTLFYGIFSAWTLWARKPNAGAFDWRTAVWHLRVPVIGALFGQIAVPARLGPLNLVEVLDWAGKALNRVDRNAFFSRFAQEHAVQYFYEPFLEAFDPDLRKELGVWYTPPEIVRYIVARVHTVLREEMGIADGLADPRVLVLDPCCGTGAFLVEVLQQIARCLRERGEDALVAVEVQRAAEERVLGFEILPAPFVIAHLQLGLLLNRLKGDEDEVEEDDKRRAGIYLTNALTGWDPADSQKVLALPELQEERDAADAVKRDSRILVIVGNPPYNGYPGVAIGEERNLVEAYRETVHAPKPQGQGLNDLYVRFFRIAERRIVEMTGRGVVCFISNYSWLHGLSHPGMRERYLRVFDKLWIDNLHGDRIIGENTPEGEVSETVFAMRGMSPGIKPGTSINLLLASGSPRDKMDEVSADVLYRDFHQARAAERRGSLIDSLVAPDFDASYDKLDPIAALGYPLRKQVHGAAYLEWPTLAEIFPISYHGVKTSCDEFAVSIDRSKLESRVAEYFDHAVSHSEIGKKYPSAMRVTQRFDPIPVREQLVRRGPVEGAIFRHAYRPFDLRWLYWEPETKLLDEKRADFRANMGAQTPYLASQKRSRREWSPPLVTYGPGDLVLLDPSTTFSPLYVTGQETGAHEQTGIFSEEDQQISPTANLSGRASKYLLQMEANPEGLFAVTLSMLHAPAYRAENAGALRQDWPRVPLPSDRGHYLACLGLGTTLVALLHPETSVEGVNAGSIRSELRPLGVPARQGGGQLNDMEDFAVTAGWGQPGPSGTVRPTPGRAIERPWFDDERAAVESGAVNLGLDPAEALSLLGDTVFDVYLNERAYWRCVPRRVWEYNLGGYPVIKKWLSYRERSLLGRALSLAEVRECSATVRRISAILLMEPALDGAYTATKAAAYTWVR